MATTTGMAKKKHADNQTSDKPKGSTDVIRVESDLAYKLSVIAAIEGENVSDVASPMLRQQVDRRYAEALRKAAEHGKPHKE